MCGHYLLADTAITPVWYVPLGRWKVMVESDVLSSKEA